MRQYAENSWGYSDLLRSVWVGVLISPGMETPQPVSETCSSVWSSEELKKINSYVEMGFPLTCAHCLLSLHWAPVSRIWLLFLTPTRPTTPWNIYTCWWEPPQLSLLQPEQPQLSQPLLAFQMLQSFNHLLDCLLNSLQNMNVWLLLPKDCKNLPFSFAECCEVPVSPTL